MQPPPRGCVLKHFSLFLRKNDLKAAASARLCVETCFRRFCFAYRSAAASARLCVETLTLLMRRQSHLRSRLRAAVC